MKRCETHACFWRSLDIFLKNIVLDYYQLNLKYLLSSVEKKFVKKDCELFYIDNQRRETNLN